MYAEFPQQQVVSIHSPPHPRRTVGMGLSTTVSVAVTSQDTAATYVIYPFVNGSQRGAYSTCYAPCTHATLYLSLPQIGAVMLLCYYDYDSYCGYLCAV